MRTTNIAHRSRPRIRKSFGGGGGDRNLESSGPDIRLRGTASHIVERYLSLARDASSSGDHILSENYLQHAEHYTRLARANGSKVEDSSLQNRRGNGSVNGKPRTVGEREHSGRSTNPRHDHSMRADGDSPRSATGGERTTGRAPHPRHDRSRMGDVDSPRSAMSGERSTGRASHPRHDRSRMADVDSPRSRSEGYQSEATADTSPPRRYNPGSSESAKPDWQPPRGSHQPRHNSSRGYEQLPPSVLGTRLGSSSNDMHRDAPSLGSGVPPQSRTENRLQDSSSSQSAHLMPSSVGDNHTVSRRRTRTSTDPRRNKASSGEQAPYQRSSADSSNQSVDQAYINPIGGGNSEERSHSQARVPSERAATIPSATPAPGARRRQSASSAAAKPELDAQPASSHAQVNNDSTVALGPKPRIRSRQTRDTQPEPEFPIPAVADNLVPRVRRATEPRQRRR